MSAAPRARRVLRCLALPLACLTAFAAVGSEAVRAAERETVRVIYLQPSEGAVAVAAEEAHFGFHVGAVEPLPVEAPDAPAIDLHVEHLPERAKLKKAFAEWQKAKTAVVVAYLPDGELAAVEEAAEKAKLPLLVLSTEPTSQDLNPKRGVFWAGGVAPMPAAMQAMDYAVAPLGSKRPALVHDGSARGTQVVKACRRWTHISQEPAGPFVVDDTFDAARAKGIAEYADSILYFGGPDGAEQLLQAVAASESEIPVLLGQGLVGAAVPTFASGAAKNTWAMSAKYFEDEGRAGTDSRYPLQDALEAAEREMMPGVVRGHRAGLWVREALTLAASAKAKDVVPAFRAINRAGAAAKPVFHHHGHATLALLSLWRSEGIEKMPACHERPETRVPIRGIQHVGFFSAEDFEWEPGTWHVWVRFRDDEKRSIEEDLHAIGLHTKGYEENLEQLIMDDLLGRVISKLNVLFLRNPDGTSVPGVSWAISFSASPPPEESKSSRRFDVLIGDDDPVAGGRASGNTAWIFSTFIRRTMYVEHKLDPALSAEDRPFLVGGYTWDSSADENIRDGLVRALVDGFAGSMALTGAHELGHLCGCGHDTEMERSIMNVVSGAGLQFEWGGWIPSHIKLLDKRLRRVPAAKR